MKKRIFLACLVGLLTATSAYSACDGGTEITNTAGTTFCKSDVKLNWWSAANWCKENEMHLATMYEMCPNWDGNEGSDKCSELNGTGGGYGWSSTAYGSEKAFYVNLSNGSVSNHSRNYDYDRYGDYYAFCR